MSRLASGSAALGIGADPADDALRPSRLDLRLRVALSWRGTFPLNAPKADMPTATLAASKFGRRIMIQA
jgi:hypothetical protein